jgi:hypothetical protein
MPHGHIYTDLVLHVGRHCNREIDGSGRDALFKFISATVVAEVERGTDYFGFRNYYLQRFASIARRLETNLMNAADREEVLAACQAEVDEMKRVFERRRGDESAVARDLGGTAVLPTPICFQFDASQVAPTPPDALEP